jgi:hypothetical protein
MHLSHAFSQNFYRLSTHTCALKVNNPGSPHSNGRDRWSTSFARAQMLWAEDFRRSEHRLGILRAVYEMCVSFELIHLELSTIGAIIYARR